MIYTGRVGRTQTAKVAVDIPDYEVKEFLEDNDLIGLKKYVEECFLDQSYNLDYFYWDDNDREVYYVNGLEDVR